MIALVVGHGKGRKPSEDLLLEGAFRHGADILMYWNRNLTWTVSILPQFGKKIEQPRSAPKKVKIL